MELVTADHGEDTDWGDDDPSVFVTNNVAGLQGEYQLFNGYGIRKARQVLRVRNQRALCLFCFAMTWSQVSFELPCLFFAGSLAHIHN